MPVWKDLDRTVVKRAGGTVRWMEEEDLRVHTHDISLLKQQYDSVVAIAYK